MKTKPAPYLGALTRKHSGVDPLRDDDESPLGSLFVFGAADDAHRLTDLLDFVLLDRVNLTCTATESYQVKSIVV